MKAVSSYLGRIQERHFKNLRRKTQKLDPVSSSQLSIYLAEQLGNVDNSGIDNDGAGCDGGVDNDNDNNSRPSSDDGSSYVDPDYELIQHDLDRAYNRLEQLETKRDFIKTRLDHYKQKIKTVEQQYYDRNINPKNTPNIGGLVADQETNINESDSANQTAKVISSDASGDETTSTSAPAPAPNHASRSTADESPSFLKKIQQYKDALKPVESTYKQIESDLNSLQRQINSMHERQQQLKLKTEECQVVLQELCLSTDPEGGETGGSGSHAGAAVAQTVSGEEGEGKGKPDEYDEEIGIAHSKPTECEVEMAGINSATNLNHR